MDRRSFLRTALGGTALSIAALSEANAEIYRHLKELDQMYPAQQSPDGVYWNEVKNQFMMEEGLTMMNNGTVGPIPKTVLNEFIRWTRVQAENPYNVYNYLPTRTDEVRTKIASFIGASLDEVAIVRNTTEGINFVASGLDLNEGDDIVMSNLEHPSGINPWRLKAKRHKVNIIEFPLGCPAKDVDTIVESFKKVVTPRTKVLMISHTCFITGLISPIKELSEEAHKRGILVLGDSAHGIGMLNLNLNATGIDFWASSPYKWLGALPDRGVFYVKKESQERLWPTVVSGGWDGANIGARKFDRLSQQLDALTLALGEAIEFNKIIGKERIARRILTLGSYLRTELAKIPKVKLHVNDDPYMSAGLTAFSMQGVNMDYVVNYIREKYDIVIRTIGSNQAGTAGIRVSTNIYVTMEDINKLLEGIRELASKA